MIHDREIDLGQGRALITPSQPEPATAGLALVDMQDRGRAWVLLMELWVAKLDRKNRRGATSRVYKIAVKQFVEWFRERVGWTGPDTPIWQTNITVAENWVRWLATEGNRGKPLSDASIQQKLAAMSSFFSFARKHGLLGADQLNPFLEIERPQIPKHGRARYPSLNELKAILGAINLKCLTGKRDYALLYTISVTCNRSNEILEMQWQDINEGAEGDYWFWYRYKGENDKARKKVLPRKAWVAIMEYLRADGRLETMQPDDYIFIAIHPGRIRRVKSMAAHEVDPNRPIGNSQANAILKKYARMAGVDVGKAHIHGLRHAGTRLRKEQMKAKLGYVDYEQLQELLGHKSLETTMTYIKSELSDPEDPGAGDAALELMPKGKRRRRKRKPAAEQAELL